MYQNFESTLHLIFGALILPLLTVFNKNLYFTGEKVCFGQRLHYFFSHRDSSKDFVFYRKSCQVLHGSNSLHCLGMLIHCFVLKASLILCQIWLWYIGIPFNQIISHGHLFGKTSQKGFLLLNYKRLFSEKSCFTGKRFLLWLLWYFLFTSPNSKLFLFRRRLISQRSSLETLEDIEENAPLRR